MGKPDIIQRTGNYVAFEFPPGIDAEIVIKIHEVHTRAGRVRSHVIYDSKEDHEYTSLVGSMARTAGLIIEHNFANGKEETETPEELSRQLDEFKSFIWAFDKEKGHQITGRLLGNAKAEIFQKEQKIKDLSMAKQDTLTEILRWHIEDALNNPPGKINPMR